MFRRELPIEVGEIVTRERFVFADLLFPRSGKSSQSGQAPRASLEWRHGECRRKACPISQRPAHYRCSSWADRTDAHRN